LFAHSYTFVGSRDVLLREAYILARWMDPSLKTPDLCLLHITNARNATEVFTCFAPARSEFVAELEAGICRVIQQSVHLRAHCQCHLESGAQRIELALLKHLLAGLIRHVDYVTRQIVLGFNLSLLDIKSGISDGLEYVIEKPESVKSFNMSRKAMLYCRRKS
jgi:hypothetical protein